MAGRTRSLRSRSRDVEAPIATPKPRRSIRQSSIATITDESDLEGHTTRKTRRKTAKEATDLTTVEEIDTQIALVEAPGTPIRDEPDNAMPFVSPGAASEMSGTTAISSFSMVEAEFLEPKYIVKHLRKLCESAEEFLEHLAPSDAKSGEDSREIDRRNINAIQQPDSEFSEDYRDFDAELNVHLNHYKSEEHNYIHVRAIHRALFGSNGNNAAIEGGLDLILYLTNLLIFTKQMIHSDRTEKQIWDVLRQLDNSFPGHFMRSLAPEDQSIASGDSALLDETYELALDLRTQLAILVLQRSFDEKELNSDVLLTEVFFRADATQEEGSASLRGWSFSHDKDQEALLPSKMHDPVVNRIQEIRDFFPVEENSQSQIDTARLEDLANHFPWMATVMRILHWARCRHVELRTAIEEAGGSVAIVNHVKKAMEEPQPVPQQAKAASVAHDSPRKKRTSFGRDRRRSSRKFDPNAPVDLRLIDALKARERNPGAQVEVEMEQQNQEEQRSQQVEQEIRSDPPVVEAQGEDWQPILGDDQGLVEKAQMDGVEEQTEETEASGPPTNSADLLKALKAVSNPQKENRPVSIFDRQTGAQRVEFGDGFDESQPTPGPSNRNKGKQPVQSSPKKRAREVESDDDSDDAFEAEERGARVQERRRKAPVAKKVRIDASSSSAPPSHQPPLRANADDDYIPQQQDQEGSYSEDEAPDMTEEAPPSSYQIQHRLALQNSGISRSAAMRKPRTAWSIREEEAFIHYMGRYPSQYSKILQYDRDSPRPALQNRTQVNLKDKARTMAINMIKYVQCYMIRVWNLN